MSLNILTLCIIKKNKAGRQNLIKLITGSSLLMKNVLGFFYLLTLVLKPRN
jgi:hypothetical protein